MAEQTMTYEQKVKSYMKIFYILIALTVIELFFVEMPKFIPGVPPLLVTVLVCSASLAKAIYVGWYFMHLNHETAWLRKLVLLSMICFFYAAVLIPDTVMSRKVVKYIPEPERVHQSAHHDTAAKASAASKDAIHQAEPAHQAEAPANPTEAPKSEEAEWK